MQYIKVSFATSIQSERDMLTAKLADADYDGFEETEHELLAYIEEPKYDAEALKILSSFGKITYATEAIPDQNWNELWESNFEPVVVDDFCTIRADFHTVEVTTPYEIIITPKMSFGTGHHATTQLMMVFMKDLDLRDKAALDFGTGTAVLAILAEKLGVHEVLAIDTDKWAVENARENTYRNDCNRISIQMASVEDIKINKFDIVFANINRHILLLYMLNLYGLTNAGGDLLISGFLVEDAEIIEEVAVKAGFHYEQMREQMGWAALHLKKI